MAGPASGEVTDVVGQTTAETTRSLVDGPRLGSTATRAVFVTSAVQSSCEDTVAGAAPPFHTRLADASVAGTPAIVESSSEAQV
jgi:hypothetical protein